MWKWDDLEETSQNAEEQEIYKCNKRIKVIKSKRSFNKNIWISNIWKVESKEKAPKTIQNSEKGRLESVDW